MPGVVLYVHPLTPQFLQCIFKHRRTSHGAGGGGAAAPLEFVNSHSSKSTWFSGKQWRKYSGKRLQPPPPPPNETGPVRLCFEMYFNYHSWWANLCRGDKHFNADPPIPLSYAVSRNADRAGWTGTRTRLGVRSEF